MNLDDRLKNIARPERSTVEKEKTKHLIHMKIEKRARSSTWTYRIVLVSVCVLALFLMATINEMPLMETGRTGTSFGNIDDQTAIEKVTVLNNMNPEKNLNIDSVFYPLKKTSTDHHYFDEALEILQRAKKNAVPWNGTIYNEFDINDYLFQLSNDEKLYLKLNTNQSMFLIDPQANMKYELSDEEWKVLDSMASEILSGEKWSTVKKIMTFIVMLLFFGISFLMHRFEKKRMKENAEEHIKPYRFLRFITTLIAILLLSLSDNFYGSLHLGIAGLFLIIVAASDFAIKYLLQKQPIIWKYIISEWVVMLSFIIFVTMIF